MPSSVLPVACQLINRPSITPDDQGCQDYLSQYLKDSGFVAHHMPFAEVKNLWLKKGNTVPLFVFAGHTDVVPTGDTQQWTSDPFTATVRDGQLYGRGAADMKGSVAAFAVAAKEFVAEHPDHKGSIALLITSDEEGPSVNGTVKVCQALQEQGQTMDYCLVGEPSSDQQLGDTVKVGRRGSLNGVLTVKGVQGHVAYPHLVRNPIHLLAPALTELCAKQWDQGNAFFPATSFQVSNLNSGTGATNVVPGQATMVFNFRFSTEQTPQGLQEAVEQILNKHGLDYAIDWTLSGEPFLTDKGLLCEALVQSIQAQTGITPTLSTTGGTSDGRFIAKICPEVVEFGPLNKTIHQIDECVGVDELEQLKNIYKTLLTKLLV